jgi:ankyrin repeat protein
MIMLMSLGGGDPNRTNRKGYTPLAEAVESGCVEASKVLRTHGALLGGPDTIKLLSTACVTGDLHGVLAILDNGKTSGRAR